ncbi:uncharacterized protein PHACADRAFT_121872 [Phanerochaete carnosa HHB-10118-sp]|uniref:Cytochrome P450 n=1 Tax=Phanerochaete carnosa (strain HHB-10118-sp) TaxID=650164 RepID=K5V0A7_PHACS|nr:uncharacterized protein PHACADRAFT_121872 [Phanerochaete carnosa HHB-10118-sp]EKM55886.1 hypothetical protein PHACADRAFT_121872 [Phanerochaete carnosa HHB-10118-sp]
MHDKALLALYTACALVGLFVIGRGSKKQHRFPPGPKGPLVIGNLFGIPRDYPWLTYAAWGRQYSSEIVHFKALGQHFVVVNGTKAAKDLFDGRSQIYSDRYYAADRKHRTGFHRNWAMMPYGENWRNHRRLFHQHFRPQAINLYHDQILKGARILIQLLLESPDDFLGHVRHTSGAILGNILYGMDMNPKGDERLEIFEKAIEIFMEIAARCIHLHEYIVKHLPTWFPGAGFKRQALVWRPQVDAMYELQYQEVKSAAKRGKVKTCIASNLMSMFPDNFEDPDVEEMLISVTGTTCVASDTTLFFLTTFFMIMLLYPEVQCKVQDELDRVVGRDRLPGIDDRDSLPYLAAVIKEILRWNPVVSSGAVHKSNADDWYDGYYIPAGTIVIGNAWAILHDEKRYPDPEAFRPERFLMPESTLNPAVPDPVEAFGFGRRICPGRHFAQATVFLYVTHILATVTITKPVDKLGNVVGPAREYTARLFSIPKPFKADIKPRFEGAEELIRLSSVPAE